MQPLERGAKEDLEHFGMVGDGACGQAFDFHGLAAHEAGVQCDE